MTRWLRRVTLLVTLLAFGAGAGCRSVRRGEPLVGALPTSDPKIARGQLVFMENCYRCHPGGEGGLGPGINDKLFPSFLMKTQVRAGLGAMPSFHNDRISHDDLDALMRFVIAQRKQSRPIR